MSGLASIDETAFQSCPITGVLEIPDSIVSIGDNAFYSTQILHLYLALLSLLSDIWHLHILPLLPL